MTKLQLFLWLPPAAVHLATSAPLHYYYNIYHCNRNDFIEARISGVLILEWMPCPSSSSLLLGLAYILVKVTVNYYCLEPVP